MKSRDACKPENIDPNLIMTEGEHMLYGGGVTQDDDTGSEEGEATFLRRRFPTPTQHKAPP